MLDLFESTEAGACEALGEQAMVLRGLALPHVPALLAALQEVQSAAPFRHMVTPGGFTMSVALTNCGEWGWTSDRHGYRYAREDPQSGQPWPALPEVFRTLAREAADRAGFAGFVPDACLINRYVPGARLSLHQDRNERDLIAPVVSVSLGIPATFLFGGHQRSDKSRRTPLWHGDIAVWGGVDRLRFHGVLPLKPAYHPLLGEQRINITFRKTR
ncbi:MAG: DNA oxidative demethylase AlkB [Janthinobacterium lividum]